MGKGLRAITIALVLAIGCAGSASAAYTPTITEYGTGITLNSAPDGITTGPDGKLYFAEYNHAAIAIISTSGAVTEVPIGAGARPRDAVGDAGQVWFTDSGNNAIGSITTDAAHTVHEYSTGMPASATPHDITVGPDGNLWFSEESAGFIGELSPSDPTHTIHNYPASALSGAGLVGLTTGPDHALWFPEPNNNTIDRLNPANPSAAPARYSSGMTHGAGPRSIASGPDGNLWFTEVGASKIGRITTGGAIAEYPLGLNSVAGSKQPDAIVAGSDGAMWFVESHGGTNAGTCHASGAVGRITASGTVQEFPLTADTSRQAADFGCAAPFYLTAGPDGNIWFTEIYDARVGRITTPPSVTTGAASNVKYASASIAGTVAGHAQPTTYHVDYGPTTAYGRSTGNVSAGSGVGPVPVSVGLKRLVPGTTYHYRVVGTNGTGPTYGNDATFTTPRTKPTRLTLRASPKPILRYPIRVKVSGRLFLPSGTPSAAVCKGQKIRVTIALGKHKVKTFKVRLKRNCKYSKKVKLGNLRGSGKLRIKAKFAGSAHLLARSSRVVKVRLG